MATAAFAAFELSNVHGQYVQGENVEVTACRDDAPGRIPRLGASGFLSLRRLIYPEPSNERIVAASAKVENRLA
jgi:hypothetical protein